MCQDFVWCQVGDGPNKEPGEEDRNMADCRLYTRVVLRGSGGVLWQTHLLAQPFQQGVEERVKGLGQEDPGHTSSFLLESVIFLKLKSYQSL